MILCYFSNYELPVAEIILIYGLNVDVFDVNQTTGFHVS
jgi:hypothetical protein